MFPSGVYYGPWRHRQFHIVVEALEDETAEVRFHHAVNAGEADEVVVEFTRVQSRLDTSAIAIREAAQRVSVAGITWLRPNANEWIVDGDTLRGRIAELAEPPLTRTPAGRHAEVSITARLRDHTWPIVNVRHHLSFDNDCWHGEFHADDGQPVRYLTMPNTASDAEIQQAIERGAARVVKNLVRHLNYRVERAPELRRTTPGPRTRLTDLREEYPIGIDVKVERKTRRTLALSFQNNSGVVQPKFAVLLLIPLVLQASIDGIPSTEQEEKYDRFTFDITTPIHDRGLTAGPTVHLAGDPNTAPADSHVFFQVKAGDSQFTTSIKIAEILDDAPKQLSRMMARK